MRNLIFLVAMATPVTAFAAPQQATNPYATHTYSYADLADFALASQVTAHVRVKDAKQLKGPLAAGTRPGFARQLVTADVIALIKASTGLPSRIQYIIDTPVDSRGKTQKLKKSESLLFAKQGRPGEVQLIAPDASVPWSEAAGKTVRAVLQEAARSDAPPVIDGISSAFHSPGSLPGEGETQIFLHTKDGRPASLTVQRLAGAAPGWNISLGEVVDEAISKPTPETLLWYRLACFLPKTMPQQAVDGQSAETIAQVNLDYDFVLSGLGACPRTRASQR